MVRPFYLKGALHGAVACVVFRHSSLAAPKPPEPPPFNLPKPPPAQVSSSEANLPLPPPPVTSQKRQEKKNPPQPPVMLTKIRSVDQEDWARTPNDLKGLLESLSGELNVNFSSNVKTFGEVSIKAADNPVLYRSGYKAFDLTPQEVARLREYILGGGTIIFNSLVGNPDAYQSALRAARLILPERQLYRLRMDHPVFRSFHTIDKVAYRERMVRDGVVVDSYPFLEGVDVDNRTAVLISRWDFALGWEANAHESWGYADADARKLGANIVAYATALREAGRSVGNSVELADKDKKTVGRFRVGQVMHNGAWKTRAAAFPMLLNQLNVETGTKVSFDVRDVSLKDSQIFEMPFMYLTGTTDFALEPEERTNLRQYLAKGGVLFVEAGEGRITFDKSFRQELTQLLPGKQLVQVPQGHELFRQPRNVSSVKVRPALAAARGNQLQQPPELYGVEVNGALAIIYTPFDWSAGWEKADAPYALGYEPQDSTALGLNVLYYAVTH
jgi:hypothetical protein